MKHSATAKEQMCRQYKSGLTLAQVGRIHGLSGSAVKYHLNLCGVKRRPPGAGAPSRKTHGHTRQRNGKHTVEFSTWQRMKTRCYNPQYHGWHRYGGRGITVCSRWKNSFSAFLADMGLRPKNKSSIDRINGDLGYFPGNCRWATSKQQQENVDPRLHDLKSHLKTCGRGHLYTKKNTRIGRSSRTGRPYRVCRKCAAIQMAAFHARIRIQDGI